MPTGNIYTPDEIYAILKAEAAKHGDVSWPNVAKGTYIVLRESGGNAKAFRPASENPAGGNDRGWWQFNSKAFPDVSDILAYDPVASTAKAWTVSDGFTQWGPWTTSRDPEFKSNVDAHKKAGEAAARAGDLFSGGNFDDFLDLPIFGPAGGLIGDAGSAILDIGSWTDGLTKLIGVIMDETFWKRIGIGALAVLILVGALVLFFRSSATSIVAGTVGDAVGEVVK
jgi:hypothetical protein